MKLITKYTDYAIKALCYTANKSDKNTLISVTEISDKLAIPRPILRNILQQLSKKRFLKSHKGKGGGFELIIPPDQIFIIDLIRVFQGPIHLIDCVVKKNICHDFENCTLKEKINIIEAKVINEIRTITIQSLL